MVAHWSAHVLADATTVEGLMAGNPTFITDLYRSELVRVRQYYATLGDPQAAYELGFGMSELGKRAPTKFLAIAAFEVQLAELLIAQGRNLTKASAHIDAAFAHAAAAESDKKGRARILSKAILLRGIVMKAHGEDESARQVLLETNQLPWWGEVDPADSIAVLRQRVMMSQSLAEHVALLKAARGYKSTRPLEYFRTIKRVFEFFINEGFSQSANALEPMVLAAFVASLSGQTPISKVSLLKNLAQASALQGDVDTALDRARVAEFAANRLGLHGQLLQIQTIAEGIQDGSVVGSLLTFRVPTR